MLKRDFTSETRRTLERNPDDVNIQRYTEDRRETLYSLRFSSSSNHRMRSCRRWGCERISENTAAASDRGGNRDACMSRRASWRWSSKTLRRIFISAERVRRISRDCEDLSLLLPSIEVQRHCPRCVIPETTFSSMFSADAEQRVSRNTATSRGSLAGKDL